jgi:hypothetical protein
MEYPLDLETLKQQVSAIVAPDQSGLTIEQRLNLLGSYIGKLAEVDKSDEAKYNELVTMLQDIGNDLNSRIEALGIVDEETLATIAENLEKLKGIIDGDAGLSIIKALDEIADTVNANLVSKSYTAVIDGESGVATVDISSLGLSDVSDYSVLVTQDVGTKFMSVNLGAKKIDEKTIEVHAQDMRFTPETIIPFNGSTDNVVVNVLVTYLNPNPISAEVVGTDGSTQQVGN